MEWKNIYRGLLMGASDVIPGVSGGTIALLLGIYDRLIEAINGLFSREWKKNLSFLVPLGKGEEMPIFSLRKLMVWFQTNILPHFHFFFLDLLWVFLLIFLAIPKFLGTLNLFYIIF